MIKAVIFDMDGVLVDSEPANNEQVADFMEALKERPTDAFLDSLVGTSFEVTSQMCVDYLGLKMDPQKFAEDLGEYMGSHPFQYSKYLNPNVREILEDLRTREYKTAIASSSLISQIQRMLKECNLENEFDLILSGEMFVESKPNPEIYLVAAQKLGVEPSECLVIEDSSFGIEAGKRAGMKVLALEDTRYGIDQSQADHKISNMLEIKQYLN